MENVLSYVVAIIELLICLIIIIYAILALVRKHRMSTFQHCLLWSLFFISLLNAAVNCYYFGISSGADKERNCYFYDDVFYGTSDILLFNLSLYMAYKLYTISNNFYEFAVNDRLTSESVQRRNRYILLLIITSSVCDLCVYVFLNAFWTFIDRNIPRLDFFVFINRIY